MQTGAASEVRGRNKRTGRNDEVMKLPVHHFRIDIAMDYGVNAAILLENIYFWIEKNRADEKHFYDGKYWTYSSMKTYTELFPYMGEKQVRNALRKLEREGVIQTGNYNKLSFDRTKWYSLTEKGQEMVNPKRINAFGERANDSAKGQMTFGERANDIRRNAGPIPDNNTDNNTDKYNLVAQAPRPLKKRYEKIIIAWNSLSGIGINPIRNVGENTKRKELLDARLAEYGEQTVLEAIGKIRESDFLRGNNKRGWSIKFDWFIKPNNFPKVLEGNYDNAKPQGNPDSVPGQRDLYDDGSWMLNGGTPPWQE